MGLKRLSIILLHNYNKPLFFNFILSILIVLVKFCWSLKNLPMLFYSVALEII